MKVKRLIFVVAAMMATTSVWAGNEVEATLGTDVTTAYIWRGQQCASFSFQPTAGLSWRGLSLSAWGSYAIAPIDKFEGSQEETDITLSYSTKNFTVGITDYYFAGQGHPYFRHGDLGETAHVFEANVGYDFGFLSVNWFTNFAGNDGVNKDGKRAYSSYLQLDAPFSLAGLEWNATLGMVPYATSFYGSDRSGGFHVNQIALRAEYGIQCGKKFKLPIFAQAIANPSSKDFFFLAGFSINAF